MIWIMGEGRSNLAILEDFIRVAILVKILIPDIGQGFLQGGIS